MRLDVMFSLISEHLRLQLYGSCVPQVGKALITTPSDFILHRDIEKILKARERMLQTGELLSIQKMLVAV